MTIATLDEVIAALPGQYRNFMKASITAKAAGQFASLWAAAGFPGAGATPAAASAGGTSYSAGGGVTGAVPWTNPTAGDTAYLAKLAAAGAVAGTLILYDRLWACAGFVGNSASAQAVTDFSGLPTRGGLGERVEAWAEWYTATGSTTASLTMRYTNAAGTSGKTTTAVTLGTSVIASQMFPLPLAAGDSGVRSVASVTLSASTGTAGSFGITLMRRIAEIPLVIANVNTTQDVFALGMPEIPSDACLAFAVLASGTTTGVLAGNLSLIAG